jgi:hypothetical protein
MRILSLEDKSRILSRLFEEQTRTGKPLVAAAMKILSSKRHDSVFKPDEQVIADISSRLSGGHNVLLSAAYLEASVAPMPNQTGERAAALCNMYEYGTPVPGLTIFGSKWDS